MATLYGALQNLAPVEFESLPHHDLKSYLHDILSQTQLLVDSVPPPPVEGGTTTPTTRSRSNTGASIASNASEISASSARSASSDPTIAALQKEWGKPIKLAPKDNPLGMAVYKLPAKDGKGTWFARRSVHEGLGFSRWKKGLEAEFPESLEVQGGPGEGNIRGIGGERLVEQRIVEGLGKLEVYHLSAQFPGPTTPRDFVTLLITSSAALTCSPASSTPELVNSEKRNPIPRHFTVVSKPCIHPDCPPRDGFIRGQYESIEFIREIPLTPVRTGNGFLTPGAARKPRSRASSLGKDAIIRNAKKSNTFPPLDGSGKNSPEEQSINGDADTNGNAEGRKRGKTISFAESRGEKARGEHMDTHGEGDEDGYDAEGEAETNPVEWIMITRSDPGGSVPRWMVERGTPSSIVADAAKFLDWARKKEHPLLDGEDEGESEVPHDHHHEKEKAEHAWHNNSHMAGVKCSETEEGAIVESPEEKEVAPAEAKGGILSAVTGAVGAGLSAVTPAVIVSHLPVHQTGATEKDAIGKQADADTESGSDSSSLATFKTATGYVDGNEAGDEAGSVNASSASIASATTASGNKEVMSLKERELAKLIERKQRLDEKLAKMRQRDEKRGTDNETKELDRLAKAHERHAKEVAKQEEKYKREVAKIEAKKEKEAKKAEERRKRQEDKDWKTAMQRERDAMRAELTLLRKEREILTTQVGELQAENTALTAKLGKLGGGNMVAELRQEIGRVGRLRAQSLESRNGGLFRSSSSRSGVSLQHLAVPGKENDRGAVSS